MSGPHILVVDDSAVMRASIKFTLEQKGCRITEANDGRHGLEQLRGMAESGDRVVMILTDVNMPNMDGITFIKNVKKTSFKFVPILVLTTEAMETKKAEGKKAGAAGWLVKPFEEDQLIAVVKRFVRELA